MIVGVVMGIFHINVSWQRLGGGYSEDAFNDACQRIAELPRVPQTYPRMGKALPRVLG
jgi:hypothetical protein